MRQIDDFVSRVCTLDYGTNAASYYSNIRAELERQGTPIGVNNLHIAGHARSEELVLVTNNLAEFERVEGLHWKTGSDSPLAQTAAVPPI